MADPPLSTTKPSSHLLKHALELQIYQRYPIFMLTQKSASLFPLDRKQLPLSAQHCLSQTSDRMGCFLYMWVTRRTNNWMWDLHCHPLPAPPLQPWLLSSVQLSSLCVGGREHSNQMNSQNSNHHSCLCPMLERLPHHRYSYLTDLRMELYFRQCVYCLLQNNPNW